VQRERPQKKFLGKKRQDLLEKRVVAVGFSEKGDEKGRRVAEVSKCFKNVKRRSFLSGAVNNACVHVKRVSGLIPSL